MARGRRTFVSILYGIPLTAAMGALALRWTGAALVLTAVPVLGMIAALAIRVRSRPAWPKRSARLPTSWMRRQYHLRGLLLLTTFAAALCGVLRWGIAGVAFVACAACCAVFVVLGIAIDTLGTTATPKPLNESHPTTAPVTSPTRKSR